MSSKRRQKKQAKKQMATMSASQMSNPTASSTVAEAMKKAEDKKNEAVAKVMEKIKDPPNGEHADAEKAVADVEKPVDNPVKTKVKVPKKKSSTEPKMIIGFGSKTKSHVVHAISNVDNSALCDIRIKDITANNDLVISDVNCRSCKRYMTFKQLEAKELKQDSPKPEVIPDTEEIKDLGSEDNHEQYNLELLKKMINRKLANMEKRLMEKLKEFCTELIEGKPSFFIVRKGNNMFQIVHENSRYVITDNISESDAEGLLVKFLSLTPKWDGKIKPSKEWLSCIRKIHEEHFKVEMPKRRSLKRRPSPSIKERKDAKPEKRVIRRRKK